MHSPRRLGEAYGAEKTVSSTYGRTGNFDAGVMAGDNPIIIKRIKKGGHGGHHGGAWKVAYADFVTAMMAVLSADVADQHHHAGTEARHRRLLRGAKHLADGERLRRRPRRRQGSDAKRAPKPAARRPCSRKMSQSSPPGIRHNACERPRRQDDGGTTANSQIPAPDSQMTQRRSSRALGAIAGETGLRQRRRSDSPGDAGKPRSRRVVQAGDDGSDAGRPAHPARRSGRQADVRAGHREADAAGAQSAGRGREDHRPAAEPHFDQRPHRRKGFHRSGRHHQLGTVRRPRKRGTRRADRFRSRPGSHLRSVCARRAPNRFCPRTRAPRPTGGSVSC